MQLRSSILLTVIVGLVAPYCLAAPAPTGGAVGRGPQLSVIKAVGTTNGAAPNLKIVVTRRSASLVPDLPAATIWAYNDAYIQNGKAYLPLNYVQEGEIESAVYELSITGGISPTPPGPVPPGPTPPPEPPVPNPDNPYVPTAAYQAACARIVAMTMGKADASNLAAVYASVGAEAASATTVVKTLADLRKSMIDRILALGLKGKYPGLGDAHDAAMSQLFGTGNPADLVDKASVAAKFNTVAWAVWGIGR